MSPSRNGTGGDMRDCWFCAVSSQRQDASTRLRFGRDDTGIRHKVSDGVSPDV